jgi:hypothetical protein
MAAFSASGWFLKALVKLLKGEIDFENDTIVIIPVSVVPDQTADEFIDDLTEINSPNARATLTSIAFNEDTGNLEAEIDAADATMNPVTAGADYLGYVVAKSTGTDSTSPVLFWSDTSNVTPNGGAIQVTFAAEGICKLTA